MKVIKNPVNKQISFQSHEEKMLSILFLLHFTSDAEKKSWKMSYLSPQMSRI